MKRESFDEAAYVKNNPDVALAIKNGHFSSGWDHFQKCGRAEGRLERGATGMSRVAKALFALNREGLGLEIGPSHNPVAPKSQGFNVHILDHASAAELRAKYAGHAHFGVKVENIEEVDFVWTGQPLPVLIGRESCYDWIIASHVIEHVPDFVSFLQQCESLLKPEGRLSLIVPDKRYCFDHFNALTSTGALLDAFAEKRKKPSVGKVFDHIANATKRNGVIAWDAKTSGIFDLIHSFAQAKEMWERAQTSPDYIDVHCWRFTPESFHLSLNDLQGLGLTRLGIVEEFETCGCEFYVTLGRVDEVIEQDRLQALKGTHAGI